jgi:hypothetical protein
MKRPKLSEIKPLVCPSCGCRHFELGATGYTRQDKTGFIVRRKFCRHCGRAVRTVEMAVA